MEADEEVELDNSLFIVQRIDKSYIRRSYSKELFGKLKSIRSFIQLSNNYNLTNIRSTAFFFFFLFKYSFYNNDIRWLPS